MRKSCLRPQAKEAVIIKKIYTAPAAELISLAPEEAVSLNEKPWTTKGFFWQQENISIPENVTTSVSTYWYDFGTEELN